MGNREGGVWWVGKPRTVRRLHPDPDPHAFALQGGQVTPVNVTVHATRVLRF